MAEKTLIANIRKDKEDPETLLVISPAVGMADGVPKVGLFLNPRDRIATVKILNQRHVLRLSHDVRGRVTECFMPNAYTPIAYGEPLIRLDPRFHESGAAESGHPLGGSSAPGEVELSGLVIVEAPSDGIFYRRPAPDSPSFVEVGSCVKDGSTLGLVEIMKCFHHITYGGPDRPAQGEIVKILAEDASEVRFGQALFHIKPTER